MDGKVAGSLAVLISLLCGALGYNILFVSQTAPNTVILSTYADATVYSAMPNLQTGSNTEMQASIDWDKQEYRYAFIMFDISSLPAGAQVTDIILKTYISYTSSGGDSYYGINWAETNWAESTITWANQPQFGVGFWESKLIGGVGTGAGWADWHVGGTAQRLMNHLATDKKMAYCISPDVVNRRSTSHFFNIRSKQYGGGFESKLVVTYTIPQYTLTVNVKFTDGNPISGADVLVDDVSVGATSVGTLSATATYGPHTLKVSYGGSTQTQSISLVSDKTVDFQFQAPTKFYDVTLIVKDQLGHLLPASVTALSQSYTCDPSGKTTIPHIAEKTSLGVSASIQVGDRVFQGNDSFTVSSSLTRTLTITRRFLWKFYFNYSDGSIPSVGTLTATSAKDTLNIPITNGYGQDYLLDGQYALTFTASPEVTLGTQVISNDGVLYATLPTAGQTVQSTTTNIPSDQTPVTTPTIPGAAPSFLMLTSTHIYILTGVLILLGAIALFVGVRRARPKR